jgi:DNA invertase Pin-like site-specific DNA recombinase
MKRTALYLRVSTLDQHPETQLHDLRQLAQQRGLEIIGTYTDYLSSTKIRRPKLEQMLADARQGKFQVLLVWACDRLARSVRHFLEVLDELNHLGIEFVSFREQLDTGGPLGRAVVVIISVVAELERNLIVERVKAGMRRAKLEGQRIGRPVCQVDVAALIRDRELGHTVTQLANRYGIGQTTVRRLLRQAAAVPPKGSLQSPLQVAETNQPVSAV